VQRKAAMNGLATFLPPGDRDPARPVSTSDAVVTGVDRPAVDVAGDVMTRDPDRVAGSDTLVEVAGRMRTLLVAFLPVCDQHGDLQGIIALRDLQRAVRGGDPTGATAFSLAEEPAITIGVDDPVGHVWDLMARAADVAAGGAGRPPPGRSHPLRHRSPVDELRAPRAPPQRLFRTVTRDAIPEA